MSLHTSSRRTALFGTVKRMALCAMLVAMSVVIGIFCKNFMNFANGLFRVTFENLPILLTGIFLGPLAGGLVGIAADLVSYFLSPQVYPPNLIVTFGACMMGVVSGLLARYAVKARGIRQIIISAGIAHIIGSMIIKSIGLFSFYGWGILWRIPLYLVIAPLEIFLLCMLWKQRSFRRLFENL